MHVSFGNVLVTGATGFIGGRLRAGNRALVRKKQNEDDVVGDLCDLNSLRTSCKNIDTVFHCAGLAHVRQVASADEYWKVNFEGTKNLVQAAGLSGVRRIVFLSSVKAMMPADDACITESDGGKPSSFYGQSKLAAEEAVLEGGVKFGMHVVNLRLAMVYGHGGRGNLERMVRGVQAGWFPPLPETWNRRSLLHVNDALSAIHLVARDSRANGATYIVADAQQYSGKKIYDAIREALGLPPIAWRAPASFLRAAGRLGDYLERHVNLRSPITGEVVNRLLGSECYLPIKIEQSLGWRSQMTLPQGLLELLGK